MNGLTKNTEKIFDAVSLLDCIKEYTLTGGTAILLQIGKRLGKDLDQLQKFLIYCAKELDIVNRKLCSLL